MRSWLLALCLGCGLMALFATSGQGQAPVLPGAVAFRNDTKGPIVVQGMTMVGGVARRGQPLLLPVGRVAGDFNLPPGLYLYSVYDANQPSRVLAKDVTITIVPGANLFMSIRHGVNNAVGIFPDSPRK